MAKKPTAQEYGDDQIDVLLGLDPVRMRPGMYVGTIRDVAYTCGREVYENSGDEASAGHCDKIWVNLSEKMARMTVRDNGRGIPLGVNRKATNPDGSQMSTIKSIYTILHSGGKFGQGGYQVSGGLHGVGASVVNALSMDFTAISRRDGKMRVYQSRGGYTINNDTGEVDEGFDPPLIDSDQPDVTGTEVTFTVNHKLNTLEGNGKHHDLAQTVHRLRELAFLIPGVSIELSLDGKHYETYFFEDATQHFKEMLATTGFELLHSEPLHKRVENDDSTFVDMTIGFTESTYKDAVQAYTNTIHQPNKGTHVDGMMQGLYDGFVEAELYHEDHPDLILNKFELQDIIKGSFAIVHVGIKNAMYNGQDKKKLVTESAFQLTYDFAKQLVAEFVENHWDEAVKVATAAYVRCENRQRNSKLKDLNGKVTLNTSKNGVDRMLIKGYTECKSRDPKKRELYIVEGDSASGNIKKRRCKDTQAIQALRGKIVNAAKKSEDAVLGSNELHSIIEALGAGVSDICDASIARFNKIIIATDADADGAHIRAELIAFFHIYMRPLLDAGLIWVAQPPLFGATNRTKYPGFTAFGQSLAEVAYNTEEFDAESVAEMQAKFSEEALREELKRKGYSVTRYKGLGEMSEVQTYDTLLNPETRSLVQLTAGDFIGDNDTVYGVMGDNVMTRREMVGGVPLRSAVYDPAA
jgi:DNA gyrase subunit B